MHPTAISPTYQTIFPTPRIPVLSTRRSPRPKGKGRISFWPVIPTPIESESPFPRAATPRANGPRLDGNQIGVLLAAFVMKETEALGKLRSDHYLVTTLVSSPMARLLGRT